MHDLDLLGAKLQILELDAGPGIPEIRRAYRELVKVWHPDRFQDDGHLKDRAEKKLKELNGAYDWLIAHEALLHEQPMPSTEASNSAGPPQSYPEGAPSSGAWPPDGRSQAPRS